MTKSAIVPGDYAEFHEQVVGVVEAAGRVAARNVNAVMTAAYSEIGRRTVARAGRRGASRLWAGAY